MSVFRRIVFALQCDGCQEIFNTTDFGEEHFNSPEEARGNAKDHADWFTVEGSVLGGPKDYCGCLKSPVVEDP